MRPLYFGRNCYLDKNWECLIMFAELEEVLLQNNFSKNLSN